MPVWHFHIRSGKKLLLFTAKWYLVTMGHVKEEKRPSKYIRHGGNQGNTLCVFKMQKCRRAWESKMFHDRQYWARWIDGRSSQWMNRTMVGFILPQSKGIWHFGKREFFLAPVWGVRLCISLKWLETVLVTDTWKIWTKSIESQLPFPNSTLKPKKNSSVYHDTVTHQWYLFKVAILNLDTDI